jgi:hypothetical protein
MRHEPDDRLLNATNSWVLAHLTGVGATHQCVRPMGFVVLVV